MLEDSWWTWKTFDLFFNSIFSSIIFLIVFALRAMLSCPSLSLSIRDERNKILDNHFSSVYPLKLSETVLLCSWIFPLFFHFFYSRQVLKSAVGSRKITFFATYETSACTSHNCIKVSRSSMFLTHIQLLFHYNLRIFFCLYCNVLHLLAGSDS